MSLPTSELKVSPEEAYEIIEQHIDSMAPSYVLRLLRQLYTRVDELNDFAKERQQMLHDTRTQLEDHADKIENLKALRETAEKNRIGNLGSSISPDFKKDVTMADILEIWKVSSREKNKIKAIKSCRTLLDLNLRDAKQLVDIFQMIYEFEFTDRTPEEPIDEIGPEEPHSGYEVRHDYPEDYYEDDIPPQGPDGYPQSEQEAYEKDSESGQPDDELPF